uniref:Protein kinase domain-containing protein n=1 Tax=Chromera velia CCMP2878 TaxID=1169474 RepID=A0A0G4FDF9_9ALVE|mmetsp:Transcript_54826/g.107265  ORF Transcript_54826/g.107265 Transcript_54826/m.107265 type:complete len:330 (+) Transcript_54826:129-1118(+)|eukprot:Cvel_3233.t1-p1 / transcript=Cvel_3233.t1 / gene=Cvel_3233 / organism=Chromera_velia_CCMP2878 / gene_product=cAMP-dependent protein kinase catalytic subunit, putative / transcript_product=cAMP-dependent protein kinase catalytic subunit, putative / location=Cvel_scaffold126:120354-122953(+) / protein_length=329 / sequence_SO=supercontig / SO=protein_coding / is_pseudo=false
MSVKKDLGGKAGKKFTVDDFNLIRTVGTGSFGRVFLAKLRLKDNSEPYAIKRLKKSAIIRQKQVDHVMSEKSVMQSLDHPFITKIGGSFQDQRYVYLIMEYVPGGELFTHLRRQGRFEDDVVRFYAGQVACIFEYLHKKNLIYRDLKPENILLDAKGYVKLTDFGFAKHVEYRTYTLCGTPEYIAPEVLLNKGHNKAVDWWTLGVFIFEATVGYPPFVDEEPLGIYQKILSGRVLFPKFFDRHAKDLVRSLLTADSGKRLGSGTAAADEVKIHRWFKDFDWGQLMRRDMQAGYTPIVKDPDDSNNYEEYPDSDEIPQVVQASIDPFLDW